MLSATWPTISVGICELLLTGVVLSIRTIPAQRSWRCPSTMMMPAGAPRVGASARMTGSCRKRRARSGLRLPLDRLPPSVPRRAMSIERSGETYRHLYSATSPRAIPGVACRHRGICRGRSGLARSCCRVTRPRMKPESGSRWGWLPIPACSKINLPACSSWHEYAEWIETVTASCEAAGLRSWKESTWDFPQGTGGGNHLLWGGPRLEANPFFGRPAWLAAILRFWQHHPSLAYLFTGCYVGASSQAPRPDESARDLYDIEMAYTFLESLPRRRSSRAYQRNAAAPANRRHWQFASQRDELRQILEHRLALWRSRSG